MIDRTIFNVLLFLNLNPSKEYHTSTIHAYNSFSNLSYCNRALIEAVPTQKELTELALFMEDTPYTVWTLPNSEAAQYISKNGFEYAKSFPLMLANLDSIADCTINNDITIKEVTTAKDLELLITICAQTYGVDSNEFRKYTTYLQSTTNSARIKYYLGYWQDQPVATSMFVIEDTTVGVHWVATLPEFRNRGLGHAVTCFPLHEIKKRGITRATLFASPLGKSIYEKIGFETVIDCAVYKPAM